MKQKTLREDAHSREAETCRKRPRSARECAKAHSFSREDGAMDSENANHADSNIWGSIITVHAYVPSNEASTEYVTIYLAIHVHLKV